MRYITLCTNNMLLRYITLSTNNMLQKHIDKNKNGLLTFNLHVRLNSMAHEKISMKSEVILETDGSIRKIQIRTLFHYKKVTRAPLI